MNVRGGDGWRGRCCEQRIVVLGFAGSRTTSERLKSQSGREVMGRSIGSINVEKVAWERPEMSHAALGLAKGARCSVNPFCRSRVTQYLQRGEGTISRGHVEPQVQGVDAVTCVVWGVEESRRAPWYSWKTFDQKTSGVTLCSFLYGVQVKKSNSDRKKSKAVDRKLYCECSQARFVFLD
jgi:hypothetical protein